ncbi:Uncharacterized protein PPKH_4953 [Pseudomonas putida]|nr:Uncharacterized protein PPKH_4953 [Pseudomonas putida]
MLLHKARHATLGGLFSLDPHSVEPTKGRWFLASYCRAFLIKK